MRRKDREITDIDDILSIIENCDSCNLGLSLNGMPYVVPLNFGYVFENGSLTLYFHGAREGRKHDIIAQNPKACFSMDRGHELLKDDKGCAFTMLYESVMGEGNIETLSGLEEKRAGLLTLMRHYSPDCEYALSDSDLSAVSVLRLNVESFTGKRLVKK